MLLSIVRQLEDFPTAPFPWFKPAGPLSAIELMLHLLGIDQLSFQTESELPLHWDSLIGQTFESVVLRRVDGSAVEQQHLIEMELKAGRPVGLLLKELDPSSNEMVEQGWAVLRMNQIGPCIFLDAVRKHPDSPQTGGRFTERRVLRFDNLPARDISAMLYWQSLVEPSPVQRRGGRPRLRTPQPAVHRSVAA
jgi:hypothetical protein